MEVIGCTLPLYLVLPGKEISSEKAKNEFLKGAKVAYESIITNFAAGNLKEIKYPEL